MTNCPSCGTPGAYVGFSKVECRNIACSHFAEFKEENPCKDVVFTAPEFYSPILRDWQQHIVDKALGQAAFEETVKAKNKLFDVLHHMAKTACCSSLYLTLKAEGWGLERDGITENDSFEEIKAKLQWGTYGKKGNKPLRYVKFIECSDAHLANIITHIGENGSKVAIEIINSILKDREEGRLPHVEDAPEALGPKWGPSILERAIVYQRLINANGDAFMLEKKSLDHACGFPNENLTTIRMHGRNEERIPYCGGDMVCILDLNDNTKKWMRVSKTLADVLNQAMNSN